MLSKKHYKAIAEIGKQALQQEEGRKVHYPDEWFAVCGFYRRFIGQLARYFQSDNPRFDRERFLNAALPDYLRECV